MARSFVAVIVFAAILSQVLTNMGNGSFHPGNFFSFFTIESNIIAGCVLVMAAVRTKRHPIAALLRGAATLYMMVTFIIYATILASAHDILLVWVNLVLHYFCPLVLMLDWVIDPAPMPWPTLRILASWLAFPLLYVAYTLVRGPIADWYPYPFLDVRVHGMQTVLLTSAVIALGFAFVSWLLISWSRFARRPFQTISS